MFFHSVNLNGSRNYWVKIWTIYGDKPDDPPSLMNARMQESTPLHFS